MGIIFGEMLGGKAVFPGSSTLNQIERVCTVVGLPDAEEVAAMDSPFATTMLDSLQVHGLPLRLAVASAQERPWGSRGQRERQCCPVLALRHAARRCLQVPKGHKAEGWRSMYPKASDEEIEMLEALMKFHPDKRLTAAEGLEHKYCKLFHDHRDATEEDPAEAQVEIELDDNDKKTTNVYRESLYTAIKEEKRKTEAAAA